MNIKASIKMMVADLDRTLLRSDMTVSEYTKDTLRRCRAASIKTVYATARGGSSSHVAPDELFDGRINQNGAAITAGGIVEKLLVPCETASKWLMPCAERGLRCASQIDETHYANFPATKLWPLVKTVETADFSAHRLDAEKLYALVETPADEAFVRENLPDGLILHISYDGMAMAMHKDASKSGAIAKLAKMWGISRDEVAAFGDDLNDIDMLAFAGYGVAVANAKPEVKSAADFACGANDEDGVAQWLEENVL